MAILPIDNGEDGLSVRNKLNTVIARVNALPTTFDYLTTSGGDMTGNIDMNGNLVTNLANPVASGDAINLSYYNRNTLSLPVVRVGGYFSPMYLQVPPAATFTPAPDRLHAYPMVVTNDVSFDEVRCRATASGAAGHRYTIGLYADNNNAYPGDLVFQTPEIDGSVTTLRVIATSPIFLRKGLYWISYLSAPATPQPSMVAFPPSAMFSCLGYRNVVNGNEQFTCVRVNTYAYATLPSGGHPAIFPPLGSTSIDLLLNTSNPLVLFRRST